MTRWTGDSFAATRLDGRRWRAFDHSNGNETYGTGANGDPNALHRYRAEQVSMGQEGYGNVILKAQRRPDGKWWSAFVSSRGLAYLPLYGRITFQARVPQESGIWPALWCCHRNGGASRAELDILEVFARQGGDRASQTLHFPSSTGNHVAAKGSNPPVGWHSYWADIRPLRGNRVRFKLGIDGSTKLTYTHPDRHLLEQGVQLDAAWDVRMNIAISKGRWTGAPRAGLGPQTMRVAGVLWTP